MAGKQVQKAANTPATGCKSKSKLRREKQKLKKAQAATSSVKSGTMAPVSVGAKVKAVSGKAIREQGTDHMFRSTVTRATDGVITQQVVMPGLFPRLAQLAKSFQRIKYHRLRFEIVTGTTTGNAGVYVAGFVADATDPVSDSTVASTLLASGGQATKYWQSTEVVVQRFGPELYYTNPHAGEERWSSPGSLVIASISPPTDTVSIEVFCHWDVTLTVPTYDAPGTTEEKASKMMVDVYTSRDNKYLSKRNGNDWTPLTHADFEPPARAGTYILGHWRCGSVENTSGTLDGIFGFFAIKVESYGSSTLVYPVDDRGSHSTQNFHAEEYVLKKGELVFYEASLLHSKVPWFRSPANPSLSYQGRSLLSLFPATSPEYWTTKNETLDSFSLEPYTVESKSRQEAEDTGSASSVKSSRPSGKSLENLTRLLSQVILSASRDSSMACPPSSLEKSTKPDPPDGPDLSDYDLLQSVVDGLVE